MPNGTFNQNGRGYPDVSITGYFYPFFDVDGGSFLHSGTENAAAIFAGMVSLANAARLNAGKGPVGMLNIILYSSFGNFTNDITEGESNCGQAYYDVLPYCCKDVGFKAAKGWDPMTGLGSINFKAFSEFLFNLGDSGTISF